MVPGIATMAVLFGPGVLIQCGAALVAAWLTEWCCLKLRAQPTQRVLQDTSTVITALLIAIAVPPSASPFVVVVGVALGIGLGKHAYGGLGQNVFNPAMVGYAIVLVSFPAAFATWPGIDGTTGATALDALKHRDGLTLEELQTAREFGRMGGAGWEWVNLAFAAGGLVLLAQRIIGWRLPITFLAGLAVLAAAFYDGGSSASLGSPQMHWTMGSTMVAAFFVLTDPVTHPNHPRAQILFALIVAVTTFVIRGWGSYPDGLAFGVLLANAATPYLERRFS